MGSKHGRPACIEAQKQILQLPLHAVGNRRAQLRRRGHQRQPLGAVAVRREGPLSRKAVRRKVQPRGVAGGRGGTRRRGEQPVVVQQEHEGAGGLQKLLKLLLLLPQPRAAVQRKGCKVGRLMAAAAAEAAAAAAAKLLCSSELDLSAAACLNRGNCAGCAANTQAACLGAAAACRCRR